MFGVEHQLRAGLIDPIEDEIVVFTMRRSFGSFPEGARLTFRAAGTGPSRAYLPVRPAGAEVLAVDGHGRPALLLRRAGAGSVVLCTYPIEHMAAMTPRVNPEATSAIYDALAVHAGVRRPVLIGDPRVAADVIVGSDGSRFAWLVSQAMEPVTIATQVAAGLELAPLDQHRRADVEAVTLPAFGAGVFRLRATPSR